MDPPTTGKLTQYRHNKNDPNSLSRDQARVIYQGKKGILWVGTGSPFLGQNEYLDKKEGLNHLNKNTGITSKHFEHGTV